MIYKKSKQDQYEEPDLVLVQKIKDGLLDPRSISKEERQRCIELFLGEGLTEAAIAQILKRSEKTIYRDLKEIREKNALTPNINLAKQITGELLQNARIHHGYLMRLARNRDATTSEKVQAEFSAWRVFNELMERMQSLGYLPSRPTEIIGDIFHHMNEDPGKSLLEINNMIVEIESVAREKGDEAPEVLEEINNLKHELKKAEIIYQADKISEKQKKDKEVKDES